MNEIKLEDIQRSENKHLSVEGTKIKLEQLMRYGKVTILTKENYFYARNWLKGNKVPYTDIKEIKDEACQTKSQSNQVSKEEEIREKRRNNMAKARASRSYLKKQTVDVV